MGAIATGKKMLGIDVLIDERDIYDDLAREYHHSRSEFIRTALLEYARKLDAAKAAAIEAVRNKYGVGVIFLLLLIQGANASEARPARRGNSGARSVRVVRRQERGGQGA